MYTFTRWVATPENRLALAAVRRLSEALSAGRLRREPFPLFLHGPAGTGKTHLVSALAGSVLRRRPDLTYALLSANECAGFLLGSAEARDQVPPDWGCDLLVVEDLQHLPARAAEAFAEVLDARCAHRQQTVLTATAGPARLLHLPARLTSRLAGGLVVGLEPLSPASRLVLLRDRAERRQLPLGGEVLAWLAEHVGGSGREVEGAITRVEALVRLHGRMPDVALLAEHFHAEAVAGRPTVERIVERVGTWFQVEPRQMQSRARSRHGLLPRQVGMYLARQLTPLSLQQIGAYFGGRDHSTVLHACRKVERALAHDAALSGAVRRLRADLA